MSGLILQGVRELHGFFLGTSRSDDSAVDRLSYRYTCLILVAFILIVSSNDLNAPRIQCWVGLNLLVMKLKTSLLINYSEP